MPYLKNPTSLNVSHHLHMDRILPIQSRKVWPAPNVYQVSTPLIVIGFRTSTTSIPQPSCGTK